MMTMSWRSNKIARAGDQQRSEVMKTISFGHREFEVSQAFGIMRRHADASIPVRDGQFWFGGCISSMAPGFRMISVSICVRWLQTGQKTTVE